MCLISFINKSGFTVTIFIRDMDVNILHPNLVQNMADARYTYIRDPNAKCGAWSAVNFDQQNNMRFCGVVDARNPTKSPIRRLCDREAKKAQAEKKPVVKSDKKPISRGFYPELFVKGTQSPEQFCQFLTEVPNDQRATFNFRIVVYEIKDKNINAYMYQQTIKVTVTNKQTGEIVIVNELTGQVSNSDKQAFIDDKTGNMKIVGSDTMIELEYNKEFISTTTKLNENEFVIGNWFRDPSMLYSRETKMQQIINTCITGYKDNDNDTFMTQLEQFISNSSVSTNDRLPQLGQTQQYEEINASLRIRPSIIPGRNGDNILPWCSLGAYLIVKFPNNEVRVTDLIWKVPHSGQCRKTEEELKQWYSKEEAVGVSQLSLTEIVKECASAHPRKQTFVNHKLQSVV